MSDFGDYVARNLADATIQVSCDTCAEVEVSRERIWLTEIDVPGRSWYGFDCPRCHRRSARSAGPATRHFLRRFVATEQIHVPAEAREEHHLPTLNADDLLDAALHLSRVHTPDDLFRAAA